jgi:hypothetical protein
MGDAEPTGEYYAFRRVGNTLTGKFRWLDAKYTRGYAWFAIRGDTELAGGWWMHDDLPPGHERKLPHVPGMVPSDWSKTSSTVPKERLRLIAERHIKE